MKRLSLLFGFLFTAGMVSAQEDVRLSEAHPSNFRTWSLGLNIGANAALGDAASYFFGEDTPNQPSGVGGFEFGTRAQLGKWFSPTLGVSGSLGYATSSGSYRALSYYEGWALDGDLSLMVNLTNMFLYGKDYQRKHAVILNIGLGAGLFEADAFADDGTSLGSAGGPDGPAILTTFPMALNYKYMLNEDWDFDVLYRHTFATIDGADALSVPSTSSDMFGYLGVGVSYNFGEEGKQSIAYYSPFEGMFADVSEMKANYDKLVADDDGDGVSNLFDADNNTPADVAVGANGAPLDVDGDGVPDYLDADPFTSKGAKVDSEGRTIDSDGDGVGDHMDEEPNTPAGELVNFKGQSVAGAGGGGGVGSYRPSVFFNFNSVSVTDANYYRLAAVASTLKANPDVNITLTGYTDASGPEEYNNTLGQRRADAVKKELVQVFGIAEGRIATTSKGENDPLANGRNNINRRVDVSVQ